MTAAHLKGMDGLAVNRHANAICTGKIAFESAVVASVVARKKHLQVYRCDICGAFHIGGGSRRGKDGNRREGRSLVVKEQR